jgi:uncharacterized membrane protein
MAVLRDFAVEWGSYYANHAVVRTLVTFAHIGGLVAGGGAALTADRGILSAAARDASERASQLTAIHNAHAVVRAGLVTVIASGVLLFAADVDTYLASRLFWTKMALVALLVANGAALTAAERRASWRTLRWTAIASLTLWLLTTLTGTGLLNIG